MMVPSWRSRLSFGFRLLLGFMLKEPIELLFDHFGSIGIQAAFTVGIQHSLEPDDVVLCLAHNLGINIGTLVRQVHRRHTEECSGLEWGLHDCQEWE